jgi:hypothetical protein
MSIHFELRRSGKPTGRVVEVPDPHEVAGPNEDRTRRMQGHQRRVIAKLDESAKWARVSASTAARRTKDTAKTPAPTP